MEGGTENVTAIEICASAHLSPFAIRRHLFPVFFGDGGPFVLRAAKVQLKAGRDLQLWVAIGQALWRRVI